MLGSKKSTGELLMLGEKTEEWGLLILGNKKLRGGAADVRGRDKGADIRGYHRF